MGITWKDKVRHEDVSKKTVSWKLEYIIKERRLRWPGHVLRMDDSRTGQRSSGYTVGTEGLQVQKKAGVTKEELGIDVIK